MDYIAWFFTRKFVYSRKFNKTTITLEKQGMGTYSFQLSLLSRSPDYGQAMELISLNPSIGVVSHVPKFGDASKSPSGDAVVSHWRCIISFRDAHPPRSHPHLPQETPHLQIARYVTLLFHCQIKGVNTSFYNETLFSMFI
jgi:hypothetical protein